MEKLLCHELQSIEYEDEQTVLISKQLERLEIIDRQCSFVDENLQAKQLLVVFDNQNEDPKCIANFIGAQKNLKFLELKDLDINKFELKDKFAVLKLEDLSLIGIQTNDDTNASNTNKNEFVQFIKSLSLRSFKMANCSFDEVIYIIMTEMKELKTLRLCADTITHKTFNNLLNVQARSITTLILDQYFSDDIFEATLRSTPDVITLRCSFKLNSSHFKSISENLTKLKYFR